MRAAGVSGERAVVSSPGQGLEAGAQGGTAAPQGGSFGKPNALQSTDAPWEGPPPGQRPGCRRTSGTGAAALGPSSPASGPSPARLPKGKVGTDEVLSRGLKR